jgi:hypothetical protein
MISLNNSWARSTLSIVFVAIGIFFEIDYLPGY